MTFHRLRTYKATHTAFLTLSCHVIICTVHTKRGASKSSMRRGKVLHDRKDRRRHAHTVLRVNRIPRDSITRSCTSAVISSFHLKTASRRTSIDDHYLFIFAIVFVNTSEGISRGQCNGKAERGRESLWTPGTGCPLCNAAITKLSIRCTLVIRGRYVPVWAMAFLCPNSLQCIQSWAGRKSIVP